MSERKQGGEFQEYNILSKKSLSTIPRSAFIFEISRPFGLAAYLLVIILFLVFINVCISLSLSKLLRL